VIRPALRRICACGRLAIESRAQLIADFSGLDGDKRFEVALRFADVWAKHHGVWQVIYTKVSQ
jgi:hypothetical protein